MYESSRSSTGITASSATPSFAAACSPITRSKTGHSSAAPSEAAKSPAPEPYSRETVTSWNMSRACCGCGTRGKTCGAPALLREQPPARRQPHQIHRRVRVELAQDAAAVRLHRARADAQLPRDLRGGHALDAELEDLPLPRGQRGDGQPGAVLAVVAQPAIVGDDESRDLGRKVGLPARDRADGLHHF